VNNISILLQRITPHIWWEYPLALWERNRVCVFSSM